MHFYPYQTEANVIGKMNDNTQIVVQRGRNFWPFMSKGEGLRHASGMCGLEIAPAPEPPILINQWRIGKQKVHCVDPTLPTAQAHDEIMDRILEIGKLVVYFPKLTFLNREAALREITLRKVGYLPGDRELPEDERLDRFSMACVAAHDLANARSLGLYHAFERGRISYEEYIEKYTPISLDEGRAIAAAERRWL